MSVRPTVQRQCLPVNADVSPHFTMRDFADFVSATLDTVPDSEAVAAAAACLDRFTAAFNDRDVGRMDLELRFPHVMLSGSGGTPAETRQARS